MPQPLNKQRFPARVALLSVLLLPTWANAACEPLAPDAAAALGIDTVLRRAALCGPAVLAADSTLAQTRADVLTAGQRPNPQVTLGLDSITANPGPARLWNKADQQVRVEQLLERGDKPRLRSAVAQALTGSAEAELGEARRDAQRAAARTFYDLAAARARVEELRQSAALAAQVQSALDRRVRAGDAAALDAIRFGLESSRVQNELRQADAEIRSQQLQLALQIGADANAASIQPNSRALAEPVSPSSRPDAEGSLENRPDVRAALLRVTAARQSRALAASQLTRDVAVGVQYNRTPMNPVGVNANTNSMGLTLSVPLFVRHAYEGERARAAADLALAEQALVRVRDAARLEVRQALGLYEVAQERRRVVVEQLLPQAQRVASGAELAYQRGASGIIDLLDARRNLRSAQIERIAAEADLAKAAAELSLAITPQVMP